MWSTHNFKLEAEPLIKRSAEFSPCRVYRYTLRREWDSSKPRMLCVLLNPSTADQYKDDPTNRKCLKWAMANGYGTLTFCNLFAFRSPYPDAMKVDLSPIGPNNSIVIQAEIRRHEIVVSGWGNDGEHMARDREVLEFHDAWWCFGINYATGCPRHPLYMRDDTKLIPFVPREAPPNE